MSRSSSAVGPCAGCCKPFSLFPFFRPLNQREIAEQVASIARAEGNEVTIEVKARNLTKTFSYDAVYGPSASQRDIYQVLSRSCLVFGSLSLSLIT